MSHGAMSELLSSMLCLISHLAKLNSRSSAFMCALQLNLSVAICLDKPSTPQAVPTKTAKPGQSWAVTVFESTCRSAESWPESLRLFGPHSLLSTLQKLSNAGNCLAVAMLA